MNNECRCAMWCARRDVLHKASWHILTRARAYHTSSVRVWHPRAHRISVDMRARIAHTEMHMFTNIASACGVYSVCIWVPISEYCFTNIVFSTNGNSAFARANIMESERRGAHTHARLRVSCARMSARTRSRVCASV